MGCLNSIMSDPPQLRTSASSSKLDMVTLHELPSELRAFLKFFAAGWYPLHRGKAGMDVWIYYC
jgi:hypothetical protein